MKDKKKVTAAPAAETAEAPPAEDTLPEMGSTKQQMLQKLATVETLLTQQGEAQKKLIFLRRISAALLLALVLVVAGGLFGIVHILGDVTSDLPELIGHTNELVQQLNSVDFNTLNDTLVNLDEGISNINFKELNASIEHLSEVAESLSNVTQLFR